MTSRAYGIAQALSAVEDEPVPEFEDGLDEVALMVALWQQKRTRVVALELADRNRTAWEARR